MAVELVTKFLSYVDEIFSKESKKALVTNNDYEWTGAHTVKVYKVSTGKMNDYDRSGTGSGVTGSRYGNVESLDATTEELTLKKDRSFTFAIDKLDEDETGQTLQAGTALARQQRLVVIPEIDSYVYGIIAAGAGTKPTAIKLTSDNIYDEITNASKTLDDAEVPEEGRYIIVNPDVYRAMKHCSDIIMETETDTQLRKQGVISNLDGAMVVKVPSVRLPQNCGFIMCHPCATVAPTKLEDYTIHQNPPGISGSLVEGRICYDAFVLENKKNAIYYQEVTSK